MLWLVVLRRELPFLHTPPSHTAAWLWIERDKRINFMSTYKFYDMLLALIIVCVFTAQANGFK
jgi:hypothetical protein